LALTRRVAFKTALQKGGRIQIPRHIRWEFKLEPSQILQVSVLFNRRWVTREQFYGRMGKDGRITIPKTICGLLEAFYGGEDAAGAVLDVTLGLLKIQGTQKKTNSRRNAGGK